MAGLPGVDTAPPFGAFEMMLYWALLPVEWLVRCRTGAGESLVSALWLTMSYFCCHFSCCCLARFPRETEIWAVLSRAADSCAATRSVAACW